LAKDDDLDLVALFAIYGDILRVEFADFVATWNRHRIRNQPDRPHVVPGVPNELYVNPPDGATDWRVDIQPGTSVNRALDVMLEPLWDVDIESFLTPETEQWCVSQLDSMGFDPMDAIERTSSTPFMNIFIELKQRVHDHMSNENNTPRLKLTPVPKGGVAEYVSVIFN
jgi:hypothetical protein